MPTVIRASQPAELLSLVPALAGFTPRRSLVLLPFCERFSSGAMRFDLPAAQGDLPAYAAQAIGMLCRVPGVDAVALIVYDDQDGTGIPHQNVVTEFLRRFDICGLTLIEALCVTGAVWADYRDDSARWHPLPSPPDSLAVAGIGDVTADQSGGAALPEVSTAARAAVAAAMTEVDVAFERQARHPSNREDAARRHPLATVAVEALDNTSAFFERMLSQHEQISAFDIAALAWCLNRAHLRDVALVQWTRTHARGAHLTSARSTRVDGDERAPETLSETLLGRGERPDPDRLGHALSLVRHVAASIPDETRVGAFVAAGWLAWALGRSSQASVYLEKAITLDPTHTMATLLQTMIDSGMLPDWAFAPRRLA